MAHKSTAICVVAVLVVAGILTLCLVVTKPLANQAFAKIPCESLTVEAHPGSATLPKGQSQMVGLTGELICGGQGNGGALIHLLVIPKYSPAPQWAVQVKTDSSGKYEYNSTPNCIHSTPNCLNILAGPPTHNTDGNTVVIAASYLGDDKYEKSKNAGTTIIIKEES